MDIRAIYKHLPLVFLLWLTMGVIFLDSGIENLFHYSLMTKRIIIFCAYLPFVVFVFWKFYRDLRDFRKTKFNLMFYISGIFCVILLCFRIFFKMPKSPSLYYCIRLFGSLAFFDLVTTKRVDIPAKVLTRDLCIYAIVLIVYRLIYLNQNIIPYSPVNEIAIGASLIFLLMIVFFDIKEAYSTPVWDFLRFFCAIGSMTLIMTLSSRVCFFTMIVAVILMIIINHDNKKILLNLLASTISAVVLVSILAALNVGDVRYSLYRATNIGKVVSFLQPSTQPSTQPGTQPSTQPSTQPTEPTVPPEHSAADRQIDRSDNARRAVIELCLEEIKKDPWFGTGVGSFQGDFITTTRWSSMPVHNIFLQTLTCYGFIGLFLFTLLLLALLFDIGFFCIHEKKTTYIRSMILLFLLIFGMLGMVQATGYDMLVLSVFIVSLSVFSLERMSRIEDGSLCCQVNSGN